MHFLDSNLDVSFLVIPTSFSYPFKDGSRFIYNIPQYHMNFYLGHVFKIS